MLKNFHSSNLDKSISLNNIKRINPFILKFAIKKFFSQAMVLKQNLYPNKLSLVIL